MPSRAIEVEHVSKSFGAATVLNDISFDVNPGENVGLLGPNGAGKSTLIHIILGLISPSSGSVKILGSDINTDRRRVLSQINFISPYGMFPNRLTVLENLKVFAHLYRVPKAMAKITELLALLQAEKLIDRPVSRLSSGEYIRIKLCKALLNDPRVLLLDEPTAYLDPQIALHVKTILLDLQKQRGISILYTSHNMREVEQLRSRVIFMGRGRVIASGSPTEVTRTILGDDRTTPDLQEVFLHVARQPSLTPEPSIAREPSK